MCVRCVCVWVGKMYAFFAGGRGGRRHLRSWWGYPGIRPWTSSYLRRNCSRVSGGVLTAVEGWNGPKGSFVFSGGGGDDTIDREGGVSGIDRASRWVVVAAVVVGYV